LKEYEENMKSQEKLFLEREKELLSKIKSLEYILKKEKEAR
jgi:hypothetical protein